MAYKRKLLPMLIAAAFVSSCAYVQPKMQTEENSARIEPTMKVSGASANAVSMYQLGRYYQGQKRFAQAIVAYQKALLADEKYTEAHNGLGVTYSRQGSYDQAITEFTSALALAPQADHIHNNLGYAHYLKGDHVAAIASFELALALNPSNQRVAKNLAQAQAALDGKTQPASNVSTSNPQKTWEIKPSQHSVNKVESRGQILRVEQPALEVKQIAPAVFELKRYEVAVDAAKPVRLQMGNVEVSNGNGVLGMARRVAAYLKQEGLTANRISNHKPFNVEKTQVQYRSGYQEQAKALQAKISGEPLLMQRDDLRAGVQLRLVLGQDLATQPDLYK